MNFRSNSIDITPETPINLTGFGPEERLSGGIRRRLEANILILNNDVALICADALFIGPTFIHEVRRRIPPGLKTLFVASHTHFAPSLDETKPGLGVTDTAWVQNVADRVARQICNQMDSAGSEARVGYGVQSCSGNVYRRRRSFLRRKFPHLAWRRVALLPDFRQEIPHNLQLVTIATASGDIGAVLWSWPCHPVEYIHTNHISSAFPGAVRDALRGHFNNDHLPVLFMPGFCADTRPAITKNYYGFLAFKPPSAEDVEVFEARIEKAAFAALAGMAEVITEPPTFNETTIPLQDLGLCGSSDIDVVTVRFGDWRITAVGAEVSSRYLEKLDFDPNKPQFFTGCGGPTFGYLPTDEQIREGGYEAYEYMPFFSVSGDWRDGISGRIVSEVLASIGRA